jgi:hypothetical protein
MTCLWIDVMNQAQHGVHLLLFGRSSTMGLPSLSRESRLLQSNLPHEKETLTPPRPRGHLLQPKPKARLESL